MQGDIFKFEVEWTSGRKKCAFFNGKLALSHEVKIIDLGWPWRPLRAIVAKRCEI